MGRITLINVEAYDIAPVIETVWEEGHRNQWDRVESRDIDSHKYGPVSFDKGEKAIQRRRL